MVEVVLQNLCRRASVGIAVWQPYPFVEFCSILVKILNLVEDFALGPK